MNTQEQIYIRNEFTYRELINEAEQRRNATEQGSKTKRNLLGRLLRHGE